MKYTRYYLLVGLLSASFGAWAQQVRVEFFTPRTVHVVKEKTPSDKQSVVVIASPEKVKVSTSTNKATGVTTYRTSALVVSVNGEQVTFADTKGNTLTAEGTHAFTPITSGPDQGSWKVRQTFSVDANEGIYGIGLLQNGKMSQRGEDRLMQQSNLEDYAHFYQSIKGYGLFWDNYSPTQIQTPEAGQSGELVLESQVGKLVDYYFMYGGDADGVIREMRHLSGQAPMFPLWTYGYHQSRERYKSQEELLDVVHNYRAHNIPLDGIIQDWQYWGSNYTWNAMEFISDFFPKAQDMIDEVHRQGAHMTISIWSSFGPKTKGYKQMEEKGHLLSFKTWPESGLSPWPPRMDYPSGVRCYDPYSAEARDIYWENLSRLHKMGIDAWWMDSTDPDHMQYKDSDLDEMTAQGSYRSVRNTFPLMAVGGVYDHQRAVDSTKRVFILTRSYFAGQQRYGANTWSGDVGSSWENFRKQVPICLNYTLTAAPHVNTDIGGFFANAYNKTSQDQTAIHNPQFQELYTRWMQYGVFCPMMRSHGTEVNREVYLYGKEGEPIYDALTSAIRLRYSLLPYIYSTSWQVTKNDDSFMRALMMDFRNDENTWDNNRQYMFGRSFLVCPVVDPLYTEEKIVKTDALSGWDAKKDDNSIWPAADWSKTHKYQVYLPAGADWFDFWTNERLSGGQTLQADAPIAHSPLYVKAGSIVPMGPDVQYAQQKPWDMLDIYVYPGANAEFTLYEDEGDNYNYEKGIYSTIQLRWNDNAKQLTIDRRQGTFPGMLQERQFRVHLIGGTEKTVSYNGKRVSVSLK